MTDESSMESEFLNSASSPCSMCETGNDTNKKHDILIIFNIFESFLKNYENYFRAKAGIVSWHPLFTSKGFGSLIAINYEFDLEELINDLKAKDLLPNTVAYKIVPYFDCKKEELYKYAKQFEERMLFVNGLYLNTTEQNICDHFSKYGKVEMVSGMIKYEVKIYSILMDTKENAKRAQRELNFSYIESSIYPLHVASFLHRRLFHDVAGLLAINELSPEFNSVDLFNEFSEYGEIYALNVCALSRSLVCLVLYKRYNDAFNAMNLCKRKNVFLFPKMNAIDGTRLFSMQRLYPDLTLITFGHPLYKAYPILRKEMDENLEMTDFYAIAGEHQKVCVSSFKTVRQLTNTIKRLLKKKQITRYEIVSSSMVFRAYELFPQLEIEDFVKKKIFYAVGITPNLSNRELREAFEKVCRVRSVSLINRQNVALVMFSRNVSKTNEKLLNILPNPVFLEDVMNRMVESEKPGNMSNGELNAIYMPINEIIDAVCRIDSNKKKYAEDRLMKMDKNKLSEISLETDKVKELVNLIVNGKDEIL